MNVNYISMSFGATENLRMREISYADAIREAHAQLLEVDERVFVIGQGLWLLGLVAG